MMQWLQAAGRLIQEQVLGMEWLNVLIGRGVSALGLDPASRWAGASSSFCTTQSRSLCCCAC